MARMKLHKNTRFGDYEVYPIYEIDFSKIAADTGYTSEESNDAVGSNAYKYREWKSINNNIGLYIPKSIPRMETQEGNIIPFWHRYNNLVGDRYMLDTDNLSSYAAVEQAKRPDDWGTNPNYITLIDTETLFRKIQYPGIESIDSSWSSSTSYYEDTKRTNVRMFYTDTGCSFACSKTTLWTSSNNYYFARCYGVGIYPTWNSQAYDEKSYSYTGPDGNILDDDYYIKDNLGVNVPSGAYQGWDSFPDGYNCQMVFVHYVQDGTDFYGVAIIQMNNFTEQSEPVAIHVSAWDKTFWGTSIISGGGGSGPWTNDGPTSYVQGGQGRFSAPSDNRGDDPQDAHNIVDGYVDRFNSNIAPLYGGYNQYVVDKADWRPMTEMMAQLWDPDLLDSWNNSMMNPLTAIITCHFMPERLCPTPNSSVDRIQVLNRYLSTNEAKKYTNPIKHEVIGEVDINSYFEGFPDYEDTNVYIYLPYIGTYQLDTEAVMEGQLAVDYTADAYTGDCLAWIWTKDRFGNSQLRYTFKGNCAKPMYLASVVGAGAQRIGIIAQTAVNVGSQAIANKMMSKYLSKFWQPFENEEGTTTWRRADSVNPLTPAITGQAIGSGINSLLNAGAKATQGNASTGVISVPVDTQCYLIITRPQWSAPEEYGKQFGYPSDIGGTINQSDTEAGDPFTNFLSVRSIKLDGLSATDDEKAEIEALMVAGVFTTND